MLFDAVALPDGADAIAADGRALEFLRDQYRHCKAMLVWGSAAAALDRAGIPTTLPDGATDPGLVQDGSADGVERFCTVLAAHRSFGRETDPPRV